MSSLIYQKKTNIRFIFHIKLIDDTLFYHLCDIVSNNFSAVALPPVFFATGGALFDMDKYISSNRIVSVSCN